MTLHLVLHVSNTRKYVMAVLTRIQGKLCDKPQGTEPSGHSTTKNNTEGIVKQPSGSMLTKKSITEE